MITALNNVAAMASYELADLGDPNAISLAQNESAFPISPRALSAGAEALHLATLYPDPDWRDLRHAISKVHDIPMDQVLCGAGSMELIGCLIRAFCGQGDEVLGTEFGYLFVATATQQAGASYVQAKEPDLRVDIDCLIKDVCDRTKIVFVCNPGNPTGTRVPNAEIVRLRAALPETVLLIVDQAYGEFDDQDHQPILDMVRDGRTVMLRTFSKAYGLASARAGWGYFPSDIATETRKLMNPNNISNVSQAMATAAMVDQDHMQSVVNRTAAIRTRFITRLQNAGMDVLESHTNFVLIRYPDSTAAKGADSVLRSSGIILRGMGGYGLPDCLRVTVGSSDVMTKVADILISLKETQNDK